MFTPAHKILLVYCPHRFSDNSTENCAHCVKNTSFCHCCYLHYNNRDRAVRAAMALPPTLARADHVYWSKIWGRYHGGRRPSNDDSFHSPTVILPAALDKTSIMQGYHRRWTCSHTSPRRSPTMVTLHDNRFAEYRWWNDGWTVKSVVIWQSSAPVIPASDHRVDHMVISWLCRPKDFV